MSDCNWKITMDEVIELVKKENFKLKKYKKSQFYCISFIESLKRIEI